MRTIRFFVLFFFIFSVGFAQNVPQPKSGRLVHDFAQIISDEIEDSLEQNLLSYEQSTTIEIAVVTVPSLDGYEIEEYTVRLANLWGVGKKSDNGLVLLVAPNERRWRIETGYALEPYISDYDAKYIGERNFPKFFREEKYGEGIKAGVYALQKELGADSWEVREEEHKRLEAEEARQRKELEQTFLWALVVLSIFGVFGLIAFGIYRFFQKRKEEKEEAIEVIREIKNLYKTSLERVQLIQKKRFKNAGDVVTLLTGAISSEMSRFSNPSSMKNSVIITDGKILINRINQATKDLFAEEDADTFVLETVRNIPAKEEALKKLLANALDSLEVLEKEAPKKIWEAYKEIEASVKNCIEESKSFLKKAEKLSSTETQEFLQAKKQAQNALNTISGIAAILQVVINKEKEWKKAKEKFANSKISKNKKEKFLNEGKDGNIVDWIVVAALVSSAESYSRRSSYSDNYDSYSGSSDSSFSSFGGGSFGGGGASGSW